MLMELIPQYDKRKSFYGKAIVETKENRPDSKILYSYQTQVAEIRNHNVTIFNTCSATTLKHIKEFLKQNGFKADSKSQIEKDYM